MSKNSTAPIATIGHNHPNAKTIAALNQVLADTYVLAVKTHGYHWNVTGPLFPQLHQLFETQYTALFAAADEVAERVRALGGFPPSSMAGFLKMSNVTENGTHTTAHHMITDLIASHKKAVADITSAIRLTQTASDDASNDLMIGRKAEHDKIIWMLSTQIED